MFPLLQTKIIIKVSPLLPESHPPPLGKDKQSDKTSHKS